MDRREFIGAALALGAAFAMGAIGGLSDGREQESGGETPPP